MGVLRCCYSFMTSLRELDMSFNQVSMLIHDRLHRTGTTVATEAMIAAALDAGQALVQEIEQTG